MSPDLQSMGTLIGTVLVDGSYRVERLIGEGGMGAVYEARHLRVDKRVAVKVMARDLASNPEALARFHREAVVTSGLGHPHIVQVLDFSTTPSGEPFLVMEFLAGEDLDHRLRRSGVMPGANVVHIIKQVASALAATHAKGIVHRDLKPGNIYLLEVAGETDFVKVLDFGISKVRSASTKLTKTSSIMGTPNYMSPEQALGRVEEIDETTDQWALACIAWECLCGRSPFLGENVPSILFQVVHEQPPSLGSSVDGLPEKVEEVLRCALAKDKRQRYPSVSAFASALELAASGLPSVAGSTALQGPCLSKAAPDVTKERATSSTTFTQTAGELEDDLDLVHSGLNKRIWALAAGATAVVLLFTFLWVRPSRPRPPLAASPPAAAQPTARPVVAPTPETTGEEDRDRAKKTAAVVTSIPILQPEARKAEPTPTPRSAKKRLPNRKSEEELWH